MQSKRGLRWLAAFLHDLEVLMNVALEAKDWIAAHVMKR